MKAEISETEKKKELTQTLFKSLIKIDFFGKYDVKKQEKAHKSYQE